MLCEFMQLIYPRSMAQVTPGSYMVAIYIPCETVRDSDGRIVTQIKAVGFCLPVSGKLRYDFKGHWAKNKHGMQYEVESYDEVIPPTKAGIIAYLSSGQIKGIGPVMAERIYDAFGVTTLDVLDKEPKKLLSISGITETKLRKICDSYLASRGARDVISFLTPYGVTPNRAIQFYRAYGKDTMKIVKEHPYRLCELAGIGFKTADKIAKSMGFHDLSPERVDEGILYTLAEAESRGHLCMEKHTLIGMCQKILETPKLTDEMVASRAQRLVQQNALICYENYVYRAKTAKTEENLAHRIHAQLKNSKSYVISDLDAKLDAEEARLRISLAPEQREAIKTALTSSVCVITGGPGTGKTLIQRVILDLYREEHPTSEICCCAPTGRAARRMEQSTGTPAYTVHKALGLVASDDGEYGTPGELHADLILVDEASMLDALLAEYLFRAIRLDAQIILVGDADQLPSVGPGAVLSELIRSERIPTIRLDKVFRQSTGSRIAVNAKLIRHGNLHLEFGEDFRFIESADLANSAKMIAALYLKEVSRCGIDHVALLSPYKKKTETGVNALNELLQSMVNPAHPEKSEITVGKRTFREGDKVMQTKNREDVNNGDIGYIQKIVISGNETAIFVDFGNGKVEEYDSSDLDMLELGYASTIHKSQGSEYRSVIINIQSAHSIMLARPLIYTAITRGKENVTLIGERRALCTAIRRIDAEKRGTCLARRLQMLKKAGKEN